MEKNPLIARDRCRKRAAAAGGIVRKAVPFALAVMMTLFVLSTVCFAGGFQQANDQGNDFFETAFTVLEILIILIGAGLTLWGIVNLLEGYGNDDPGANRRWCVVDMLH